MIPSCTRDGLDCPYTTNLTEAMFSCLKKQLLKGSADGSLSHLIHTLISHAIPKHIRNFSKGQLNTDTSVKKKFNLHYILNFIEIRGIPIYNYMILFPMKFL